MTRPRTTVLWAATAVLASGCGLVQHSAALTFQVGNVECAPAKAANALGQVCSFLAFYGNISKHPIQVEPATTMVLDKTGKTFSPVPDTKTVGSFLLKPGQQQQVSWSVTLPGNTTPSKVQWHGSAVDVQFEVPGAINPSSPGDEPSASASVAPSSSVAPTTPAPTTGAPTTTPPPTTTPAATTTKATVKPTKTTVKPTKTTVKPTKTTAAPTTTPPPPTTTPPPTHVRHTTPPVQHTTVPPTTPDTGGSTNPGGGSGHIG
ncbi:hypothetical protein acdb102_13520 [Acidothermaceae bacterium B102]|nr:hypothetical protein acdb102_13520 [Acidothermaceae bacterium B102]